MSDNLFKKSEGATTDDLHDLIMAIRSEQLRTDEERWKALESQLNVIENQVAKIYDGLVVAVVLGFIYAILYKWGVI
jgi:hypothetical protein